MRLPVISGREMIKVLHRKGWIVSRKTRRGSHVIMQKEGVIDELSVPLHDELKPGIVHRCIAIAGLTGDDF
ncbi:MAG: type II toxin-antitoxin system HicA family toxin [Methanoregula sp.]|nr:MAG: type II toxin-antitoxin system HicA family toxin [Methanoregula sp.]